MLQVSTCTFLTFTALSVLSAAEVGERIRIVTVTEPPFVTYDPSQSGDAAFGGALIDIVRYALTGSTYQYEFYLSPDGSIGAQRSTGVWTGAVGEIAARRANLTACVFFITAQRLKVVSFSIPFASTGRVILVRAETKIASMWSWLRPFSVELWLLILVMVLASIVLVYGVDTWSPYGSWMIAQGDEKREFDLPNSVHGAFSAMLGRDWGLPRATSSRVLMTAFVFMVLFIHTAYEAGLAGQQVLASLQTGISGIKDVQRDALPFAVSANSAHSSFILTNPILRFRQMATHMRQLPSLRAAVQALRDKQVDAVLGSIQTLQAYASEHPCDVRTAGLPVSLNFWAIGSQKSTHETPLQAFVNKRILQGLEDGSIARILQASIDSAGTCPEAWRTGDAQSEPNGRSASVSEFSGIFSLFALLLVMAWVMLMLECGVHRYKNSSSWIAFLSKQLGNGTESEVPDDFIKFPVLGSRSRSMVQLPDTVLASNPLVRAPVADKRSFPSQKIGRRQRNGTNPHS